MLFKCDINILWKTVYLWPVFNLSSSPFLVNDMTIYLCHHVRLCMSGITLDRFDISTTELQAWCCPVKPAIWFWCQSAGACWPDHRGCSFYFSRNGQTDRKRAKNTDCSAVVRPRKPVDGIYEGLQSGTIFCSTISVIIKISPSFQKRMTEIFCLAYSCSNQSAISRISIPS